MSGAGVRPSGWRWRAGGGYYRETARELRERPRLPDPAQLRDRRLADLFAIHGGLTGGSSVLEIGCGRSPWLPYLARTYGCSVTGIDIEPLAADLARANLEGAGAGGEILCRDAFDPEGREDLLGRFDLVYSMGVMEHYDDVVERLSAAALYLKPAGRLLTTVPNLQGFNWLMQRLADLRTLETHVVYDAVLLAAVHRAAGLECLAGGYVGFLDGHLSSAAGSAGPLRRRLHGAACRLAGRCGQAWLRLARERATPELGWLSPHVFAVGRRPLEAA